jgi:hypothetical protein
MPSLTLGEIVRVNPDVVWREIDGEIVLLNVVTGLYYGLDEAGAAIWRQVVEAPTTLQAVCEGLFSQFDGDPATIEQDVVALAGKLSDAQLLLLSA